MYIEFTLPQGAGGHAAAVVNSILINELYNWYEQYQIPYRSKIYKFTRRVTFDSNEYYSFFSMTWNPKSSKFPSYIKNFRLIEPMAAQ